MFTSRVPDQDYGTVQKEAAHAAYGRGLPWAATSPDKSRRTVNSLTSLPSGLRSRQGGDLSGDRGGVERVAVGEQLGLLGWREHVGCEQPLQWHLGLVVEPGPPAVAVGAEPDGFLRRGQVVEPVVDQRIARP